MIELNRQKMEMLRSSNGGYTKALTDKLGVSWPLSKGWKSKIEKSLVQITNEDFSMLLSIKDLRCPRVRKSRVKNI